MLDVRARTITDEMALTAACELARFAEERGIHEDDIVPRMDEWEVFPRVAAAVGLKACDQGLATLPLDRAQRHESAAKKIQQAQQATQVLMREQLIAPPKRDCSPP